MKTLFFVQPYLMKRHKLVASGALTFDEAADALAAGRRTARFRAGVVVLAQQIEARSGFMGQPRVIAIHGHVPEIWRERATAEHAA